MTEVVFFLEEPSAEAMLVGFLPKIFSSNNAVFRFIVFEGKQDLLKRLEKRLRGYRVPDARFVVLCDKDSGDCKALKNRILEKCKNASRENVLVRIACYELESWYLADLKAVEFGLGINRLERIQNQRPYFAPDALTSPSDHLARLAPTYQKLGSSRAIGTHLDPNNVRSRSFSVFVCGLRLMAKSLPNASQNHY